MWVTIGVDASRKSPSRQDELTAPLLTEGRFGRALIPPPAGSFAEAAVVRTRDARPEYGRLPLTVELWLKTLTNDQPWNIGAPAFLALALPRDPVWLVVRDESSIVAWWKLYDPRREQPDKSIQAHVTDRAWHYLAVTCDQQSCDLYLDGARQGSGSPGFAKGPPLGTSLVVRRLPQPGHAQHPQREWGNRRGPPFRRRAARLHRSLGPLPARRTYHRTIAFR
jgi:hypothetical protein